MPLTLQIPHQAVNGSRWVPRANSGASTSKWQADFAGTFFAIRLLPIEVQISEAMGIEVVRTAQLMKGHVGACQNPENYQLERYILEKTLPKDCFSLPYQTVIFHKNEALTNCVQYHKDGLTGCLCDRT